MTILFGGTIALIGSIPSLVALFIAFALCFFLGLNQIKSRKHLPLFLLTVIVIGLLLVFAYLPFNGNALATIRIKFSKRDSVTICYLLENICFSLPEIHHSLVQVLLHIFLTSPHINQLNTITLLPIWNVTFDTANNEFLQIIATLGIFGFLALVYFCIVILVEQLEKSFIGQTRCST
jgi:hypothetical protein